MKKNLLISALIFIFLSACHSQSVNNTTISNESHSSQRMTITDSQDHLKIEVEGDISFNETETAIQHISENGIVRYKKDNKKFTAKNDGSGNISYEIYAGTKQFGPDSEIGKSILQDAISTMILHGIDIKGHAFRIYKKGGVSALVQETNQFKSDYQKSSWISVVLKQYTLSTAEKNNLLLLTTNIESDYEKAGVLGKFGDQFLSDASSVSTYLLVVKSIGSDYEKAGVIKSLLQKKSISENHIAECLSIISSIGSDYEKAGVLEQILSTQNISENDFDATLKVVQTIGSDYEKAGILEKLLQAQNIPSENFNKLLSVVNSIGSDYEKKNAVSAEAGFRWMIWKGLNFRIGVIAVAAKDQDVKINPTPGISYSFKF